MLKGVKGCSLEPFLKNISIIITTSVGASVGALICLRFGCVLAQPFLKRLFA